MTVASRLLARGHLHIRMSRADSSPNGEDAYLSRLPGFCTNCERPIG